MLLQALSVVIILLLAYGLVGAWFDRREGESADRTAERVGDRVQDATGGILSVTRVLVLSVLGIAVTAFQEGAMLLGEGPVIGAELVTIGLGYLALDGQLALDANGFAILALVAAIGGVIWRNA